jgi:hypothetical protein
MYLTPFPTSTPFGYVLISDQLPSKKIEIVNNQNTYIEDEQGNTMAKIKSKKGQTTIYKTYT